MCVGWDVRVKDDDFVLTVWKLQVWSFENAKSQMKRITKLFFFQPVSTGGERTRGKRYFEGEIFPRKSPLVVPVLNLIVLR